MTTLHSIPFNVLTLGQQATFSKTLTEQDIVLFAHTSGDINPVHLDKGYAETTPFKQCIAHGMWSAGLISAAIATKLPGPGSIYLGQSLRFARPVFVGDTLNVTLTVKEKHERKRRVIIGCSVTNQAGKEVVSGEAEVMAPETAATHPAPHLPDISLTTSK
ncbi:MaoC family dehydratase [Zooshikella harenae]|uniref:MaoC family dehydratase n=1 Tax=Zooshikella harenae TaxID=2827238 RepID=A0ABS5ZE74_9GAMM|nr:MaoC family dehydratase [Zooshikella harenae]MBU2712369.1 MaoC family dehydratase [Zooshikella harenae]